MADLSSLENITIVGRQYGAYYEIGYNIQDCGFVPLDTIIQYLIDNSSSGGLFEYEATPINPEDTACFVTASVQGATFERTGGAAQNTEGTLTIGGILRGLTIHFDGDQAPGNTFYLNVDRLGTALDVNGDLNSIRPVLATVSNKPAALSEGTPAQNYVHSGTPLFTQIVDINDDGTRVRTRIKIQNYNQQVGSGASILTIIFP